MWMYLTSIEHKNLLLIFIACSSQMIWTALIWVFEASSNVKTSWNNNLMVAYYFKICNVRWMKGTLICDNSLSPKQSITAIWLVSDIKHHKQCSGMPRFAHHGITLSMRFQISRQTRSRSHSASEPIFSTWNHAYQITWCNECTKCMI